MIPYLLILAFIVFMSAIIQNNKTKGAANNLLLAILILVTSAFIGFRFNVGTDYASYYRGYKYYGSMSWKDVLMIDDPGLRILAKIGNYFTDEPAFMFFVAALIFTALIVTSIYKYTDKFLFAMFLFVCSGTFLESFNGVKQATATAVIFFGLRYVKDKKFIKYLIAVLIATIFHSTAILMLVLYFFLNRKASYVNLIILIAISIILALSYNGLYELVEFITGKDVNLEYNYYTTEVNILRVLVALAPAVLVLFLYRDDRYDKSFECNLLIFNAALMCITSSSAFLARIAMYSTAGVSIGMMGVRSRLPIKKEAQALLDTIIVVAYVAYYIMSVLLTANLYPYQFYF